MTVNLGPVAPTLAEPEVIATGAGSAYNPRCLKRDVSVWVSSQWTTDQNSTDLITQNADVYTFQNTMQGNFSAGFYGVHTGGHFTIGGDPAFFLHHSQIDRTWWIWQNQDLANRQNAIAGTITLNNDPPSRNGTLEDMLNLGYANTNSITIGDGMSTLAGPYCYIYV
jgi:tyrosinase